MSVLQSIQTLLINEGLVTDNWSETITSWGEKVALYRDYQAGDHRLEMSDKMKSMLRTDDPFTDNYCELIVSYITSRLQVGGFDSGDELANKWLDMVLLISKWDVLQQELWEALIRDGDTFLLMEFNADLGMVEMFHEPAWDNVIGMIPVYTSGYDQLDAAVKVWFDTVDGEAVTRVNLYFPNRVVRYALADDKLRLIDEQSWTDDNGVPLGVPIFHFRNRGRTSAAFGRSKLQNIIPLQDALNRIVLSMVMAGELSAFQIKVAYNCDVPEYVEPGMFILVDETSVSPGQQAKIEVLPAGELAPFIEEARFIVNQMGTIGNTVFPEFMGSSAESGEALKQREVGMLAEIQDVHTTAGGTLNDALIYLAYIHAVFGAQYPPDVEQWQPQWADPNPRNNTEVIQNALSVRELVGDREALRIIAPIFGYTEEKIDKILMERASDDAAVFSQLAGLPAVIPGAALPAGNQPIAQE